MAIVEDLSTAKPTAAQLLGKDLVLWRDGQGSWQAHEDVCPHRCSVGVAMFGHAARGQQWSQVQYWASIAHRYRQHRGGSAWQQTGGGCRQASLRAGLFLAACLGVVQVHLHDLGDLLFCFPDGKADCMPLLTLFSLSH